VDINFPNITFKGPAVTDNGLLNDLPGDLKSLLQETNGFIAFGGGLHIRGICGPPEWHSLQAIWIGDKALSGMFSNVQEDDIPFGQDCVGDQFLLRGNEVHRLNGETGEIKNMRMELPTFFEEIRENPIEILGLHPLIQMEREGKELKPGQLISAFPPFVVAESRKGVSLEPVPTMERIYFLADVAKQISSLPDGSRAEFKMVGNRIVIKQVD
jgi:hypothetical protein